VPQAGKAHDGAEFQGLSLLLTSYVDGVVEIRLCLGAMRNRD
jgi:hypothetical protein